MQYFSVKPRGRTAAGQPAYYHILCAKLDALLLRIANTSHKRGAHGGGKKLPFFIISLEKHQILSAIQRQAAAQVA